MNLPWSIVRKLALVAFAAIAGTHTALGAEDLQGAGSTFVAPVMTKWAEEYGQLKGVKITYQAIGSGAGIEKIRSREVDFGATDKPLSTDELKAAGLCQFPVVIGGVVPVVNLPGIGPRQIKFTGELLADIYMGKVTMWNAPEIARFNPHLALPAIPISVVHRSDRSGTTFNWVSFLSRTSAAWKSGVGTGLTVAWPLGTGAEGNAGMAASIERTPGTIGYVEYNHALKNALAYAQVQNAHGLFVTPSPESFQEAAATVDWKYFKDFSVTIGDAAGGPNAYPITATTFVLMPKTPKDGVRSSTLLAFFKWALEDGDTDVSALQYVALPPTLILRVEGYWAANISVEQSSN